MADASDNEVPILSRLGAPAGATRKRRRKGRGPGSGLGKTCGKGQKGQRSRSGGGVAVWFEGGQTPLQRRLPKVGFKNPFAKNIAVVNLDSLARFDAGAEVGPEALLAAGLIGKHFDGVKVLGRGALDKALKVKAHAFSKSAKAAIEGAGGSTEVLPTKKAAAAETN